MVEIDYAGVGTRRLKQELNSIIKGTGGEIIEAELYEPAKGGGWAALFSSEYAALKVYYKWRHNNAHLTKTPRGWAVSAGKS